MKNTDKSVMEANLARWRKQKGEQDLRTFGTRIKEEKDRLRFHVSWKALAISVLSVMATILVIGITQTIINKPKNDAIDAKLEQFSQIHIGMSEADAVRIIGEKPTELGGKRLIDISETRPWNILSHLFSPNITPSSRHIYFENGIVTNIDCWMMIVY